MTTFEPNPRLEENIARVRAEVAEAAVKSGRRAEMVSIIAVTKYVDAALARQVVNAGLHDLGESKPQEIWKKAPELSDLSVNWDLIGHLQRNKVRRTLPLVSLIHSVDSFRLLEELEAESARIEKKCTVLLEVNISGDATKTGFPPDELETAVDKVWEMKWIAVCGLMSMAGLDSDASTARRQFAAVRELRDRLRANAPRNKFIYELSMGMSNDFREAIAEGATMVRIGSSLFEGVLPS
jgi:PLP dependent protein